MTADELEAFRKEVREELQKAADMLGRPVVHDFGVAAAVAAGALRDVPPFAVISAATPDPCLGPSWPVRVYPWYPPNPPTHTQKKGGKKKKTEVRFDMLFFVGMMVYPFCVCPLFHL